MDDDATMRGRAAELRLRAEALIGQLDEAKRTSERNLASIGDVDTYKRVTGRSSLDNAIVATRRLVAEVDRAVGLGTIRVMAPGLNVQADAGRRVCV